MCESQDKRDMQPEETIYEKPMIIFDSVITTRAGSPILDQAPDLSNQRPEIDLFPSE